MGCGASKLNPEHNGVPIRLRPVLWRRFEESQARVSGGIGVIHNDPSKKQPLITDGSCKEHDSITNENNQTIGDDPPSWSKISSNNEEKNTNLCKDDKMDLDNNVGKVGNEIGKEKGLVEMENEEVDEHEMVGLASPSFRVYCKTNIDTISNLDDEEEYNEVENVVDYQRISTSNESLSSNEVSVKHPSNKGSRGNKFKIIPKGGKTKFNKKSLPNLSCTSNNCHDNYHPLQKAAF